MFTKRHRITLLFNANKAYDRQVEHPYRQPEQRMVAPDFNHNSFYRRRQTATDERFVHQSDGVKTGR